MSHQSSDACSSQGQRQQNTNSQTYTTIPRDWPIWLPHYATTTPTSPPSTETSVREPTPVQRWMNETAQQSPWNNIVEVEIGSGRFGEGVNGGMGDGGSAAGTWGSKSE
ncbi:hypothetical protein IFR05_006160 [Cadophora sp. M221]|nr:hypothetical protein IFR05_006160 [Cadophora sp. M221]